MPLLDPLILDLGHLIIGCTCQSSHVSQLGHLVMSVVHQLLGQLGVARAVKGAVEWVAVGETRLRAVVAAAVMHYSRTPYFLVTRIQFNKSL